MERLSSALMEYRKTSEKDSRFNKVGKLIVAWKKVASPQILKHTNNITLDKKDESIVLIYMDSAVWVAECDMSREAYKIFFSMELNIPIKQVKFLMTQNKKFNRSFIENNKKAESKEKEPDVVLSKEQLQKIRLETEKIKDDKLRESAYKAMKANYEWKNSLDMDNCR